MGFFDRFKSSDTASKNAITDTRPVTDPLPDPLVIAPASILAGREKEFFELKDFQGKNKYKLVDKLLLADERLYSAIELMAIMIQKSIGKCSIRKPEGEERTNEEENAIEVADEFCIKMNVPRMFYQYTIDLWKYGDAVDLIKFDSSGVTGLEPWPMYLVTAIDNLSQRGQSLAFRDEVIMRPKWYLLDEHEAEPSYPNLTVKKERIMHISFNNHRTTVYDNLGRQTFNVWSMPPITTLVGILMWKQHLIRNDMLWRNRALPREHHRLDLSQYDPTRYTGTHSEKLSKAKTDAEKAIKAYNTNNQKREADQGFTTGMGVEIGYIEPAHATYNDPSPIIDQINSLIGGPTGTPSALMGGESKGFTSLVHASSFLALRAEVYAGVIQVKVEALIKRHIKLARPGIRSEVVDRIFIKNRLILDRDRAELAKIVAVLTESKAFTMDEVRQIWGLDPATEDQIKDIKEWLEVTNPTPEPFGGGGPNNNSPGQTAQNVKARGQNSEGLATRGMESSVQRQRNTNTRGQARR